MRNGHGGLKEYLTSCKPACFAIRSSLPRLALCIRFEDVDPETGIEMKYSVVPPKDVYPIDIVENQAGIQGSCALYKRRTDVTKHVRSTSLTPLVRLQEAADRLVVWASLSYMC